MFRAMAFGELIGIGASTAAVLAACYGGGVFSLSIWRRTIGSRRHTARQIDQLACGVTYDYVVDLLGKPAFRRPVSSLIEYTWRTPHTWVCALFRDEAAAGFAVTVIDSKFHFDCSHLTFDQMRVQLGRSMLTDAPLRGSSEIAIGARRLSVKDTHYFGNSGAHQTYILAHNDAGVGEILLAGSTDIASANNSVYQADSGALVRHRTVANTLIVRGPQEGDSLSESWEGVDKDFVRTLRVPRCALHRSGSVRSAPIGLRCDPGRSSSAASARRTSARVLGRGTMSR